MGDGLAKAEENGLDPQAARKKSGLSRDKLAEAAGVSYQAVAFAESGRLKNKELAAKIRRALGYEAEEYMQLVEAKREKDRLAVRSG